MDKIKTFNIIVDYDTDGEMIRNSFVYQPAVEIEKFAFSKEMMVFNQGISNQCFMSVSILADTPIPRKSSNGEKFNVVFTKEMVRVIMNKLAMNGKLNEVSWQHSVQMIEGVYLVEQFISEKDRVYSPKFNVPEGSLIQTYWVKDKKMYDKLSADKSFQGFSIEIEASIQEVFTTSFSSMYELNKDASDIDVILNDETLLDDVKFEKIKQILTKY